MTRFEWQISTGATQSLELDVTITERHDPQADVTEEPVEEGSNVTDSVRKKAQALQLRVMVADAYKKGGQLTVEQGRAKKIADQFEQLQLNGTRLRVEISSTRTSFGKVYENMVIVGSPFSRDKDTGSSLQFDLSLREIRVVSSQVVPVQKAKKDTPRAQKKANLGDQRGKQEETTENESLAHAGLGALIGGFAQ